MTWREEAAAKRARYSEFSVWSPILAGLFWPWAGLIAFGTWIAAGFICGSCVDDPDWVLLPVLRLVAMAPLVLAFLSGVVGIVKTIRNDDVKGKFLAVLGMTLSVMFWLMSWSWFS